MAEKLRGIPFDANEIILPDGSAGYDNVLYSADFAEWLHTYFKNGVLVPGGAMITTELQVTQISDTNVEVNNGNMVVNGRTAFVTSPVSFEIDKAGPGMERYDRIVVELNLATTINCFRLSVIQGSMSANPTIPELVRTEEVYQMSLAVIKSSQSGIETVTDTREDDSVCGISQVLIGVRTPLPVTGDSADNISYDNTSTGLNATTVQGAIDSLVSKEYFPVLPQSGWEDDNTQTISVFGITANDRPEVDVIAADKNESKLWGNIWKVETLTNAMKFYSSKALDKDLNIKIKVVR